MKNHEKSIDPASQKMLDKAYAEGIQTVWDRLEAQQPHCGFGELGLCCRHCNMGPCRIDPFGNGPKLGVCGANADTIASRQLVRMIAAGAAAHSDHGRDIVLAFRAAAEHGEGDYKFKDEKKLLALASEFNIPTEGRTIQEIALDVSDIALDEYGMRGQKLQFTKRAPKVRQDLWTSLGVDPRGIDREVVECMHRTTMGVDTDYVNLTLQGIRTSLSDGWGGSMWATELSDVLFGTPEVVKGWSNLGVLSDKEVNIVVHGHEPTLSDIIVFAARDPELLKKAKEKGAEGINICGMCCTGNEILMRHGVPIAGNFLQQELAIITGAVEAMIVDVQCIMPSLPTVANCFHTKVISTSPKAVFPGATHVPFDEKNAMETAKQIISIAIDNYPNRNQGRVNIPSDRMGYMAGFSVETILGALGGTLDPLLDAIKSGSIRGIAGIVGCNNPKVRQDHNHIALAKELIKNNVLVVETGCAAIASAKAGLLLPEAADMAGEGLAAVCRALGVPPVLHMGSCVDNSRVLVVAAAIANALGVDISDLPLAAAAPEWMSEKAVAIGTYAVSSGIYTVLNSPPPVLGSSNLTNLLTAGAEGVVGAVFAVEADPVKQAGLIIEHIEKKRTALGL
ncbi:anaerobic carbon-monoxide dehydrogenase catalytic subunit [Parasporobacterium paucivorans]|uniref:anaerobic carbon-monoxide dehydrogenase n=1 Tax=Parasporobacterium paucivorans DSM 15970 TaxID=1122934 RepID=A0A1M6ITS1_9FIRM|nr:anaerobic carbon-monoxide dehydrogenase catalytic subunit [Parasporobacterium paucivorans]SHJ37804.1 Ni-dependent carbon monoxide dehydrogenase precursor [Parasporobacterium paucivorans DSM 15970]